MLPFRTEVAGRKRGSLLLQQGHLSLSLSLPLFACTLSRSPFHTFAAPPLYLAVVITLAEAKAGKIKAESRRGGARWGVCASTSTSTSASASKEEKGKVRVERRLK
mmetsp:Transcript_47842/g.124158  ORF Transcript_47842/g.124158 Transcript_47842/m.124158 type:complete len:106 (-) Transcript_47842:1110-1427(-)